MVVIMHCFTLKAYLYLVNQDQSVWIWEPDRAAISFCFNVFNFTHLFWFDSSTCTREMVKLSFLVLRLAQVETNVLILIWSWYQTTTWHRSTYRIHMYWSVLIVQPRPCVVRVTPSNNKERFPKGTHTNHFLHSWWIRGINSWWLFLHPSIRSRCLLVVQCKTCGRWRCRGGVCQWSCCKSKIISYRLTSKLTIKSSFKTDTTTFHFQCNTILSPVPVRAKMEGKS